MVTWDRTPLGLDRRSVSAARCAGCGGIGKTLEAPRFRGFRRCTGRLNATQPGVLAVSPSYIRGMTARRKGRRREQEGKRACAATGPVVLEGFLKCRLTVGFYCVNRAARRHRIIGEPRKL